MNTTFTGGIEAGCITPYVARLLDLEKKSRRDPKVMCCRRQGKRRRVGAMIDGSNWEFQSVHAAAKVLGCSPDHICKVLDERRGVVCTGHRIWEAK